MHTDIEKTIQLWVHLDYHYVLQNRCMYIQHYENIYVHQLREQSFTHISLECNVTKILYTCSMVDKRTGPPRKSRRIAARQWSRTNTLLVHIAAEQTSEQQQNVKQDTMQQQIQSCISAAIPVITALTAHGIIMPLLAWNQ